MSFRLFPQLPRRDAEALAAAHGSASVAELRAIAGARHEAQIFSPTGGQQVASRELEEFASTVRAHCGENTKPVAADRQLAPIIRETIEITRHEAALDGVWSFFGCVLLPDFVRWRFSGEVTPAERFLGAGSGVRNALGRLWWRVELLRDEDPPPGKDEYWLLQELNDDEVSGIVDRPRVFASRTVAVSMARALLSTDCKGLARMEVSRDAVKGLLRYGYFLEFDALRRDELRVACQSLHRRSVNSLLARQERRD